MFEHLIEYCIIRYNETSFALFTIIIYSSTMWTNVFTQSLSEKISPKRIFNKEVISVKPFTLPILGFTLPNLLSSSSSV